MLMWYLKYLTEKSLFLYIWAHFKSSYNHSWSLNIFPIFKDFFFFFFFRTPHTVSTTFITYCQHTTENIFGICSPTGSKYFLTDYFSIFFNNSVELNQFWNILLNWQLSLNRCSVTTDSMNFFTLKCILISCNICPQHRQVLVYT